MERSFHQYGAAVLGFAALIFFMMGIIAFGRAPSANCGGESMRPGDTCVRGAGSYTYEEELEGSRTEGWLLFAMGGVLLVFSGADLLWLRRDKRRRELVRSLVESDRRLAEMGGIEGLRRRITEIREQMREAEG